MNRKETVGEGNSENKCENGFRNRVSNGLSKGQSGNVLGGGETG